MNRFRQSAFRRWAVLGVCASALIVLPGTSVWATARSIAARTVAGVVRAVAPAFGLSGSAPPPALDATMTASLATDTDGDGQADPGDVIRYSTTITNSGTDATGVHFNDAIGAHTTLVAGSIVVSPRAYNDSYTSVGNMTLATASIGADCDADGKYSVACNDILAGSLTGFGATQDTATVAPDGTNTVSTAHGTVKMSADGSFIYNPVAGYEGTDTFWYTLSNTTVTPNLTDTAQVTITVGGVLSGVNQMVWFVDSAAGAGTGTQSSPFNSLSALAAVNDGTGTHPTFGDTIYLLERGTAYSGPFALLQNQRFIGQDATLSPWFLNAPAPQQGNAYPAVNPNAGTKVTIASSVGHALTSASGTTLAGFTVGTSAANQFAISGSPGSLSVRDVTINSSAGGLSLNQTSVVGDATFTGFTSVTSTGGANGLKLFGVSGTLALGTGALSGASGATVSVAGGSAAVTYGGSLTQVSGSASSVLDVVTLSGVRNTSTMTLSGAVNVASAIGMQFNGADGTYTFSSPVTMTGGAQIFITNNSAGSFNFTNSGTSITDPGGAAVSMNGGTGSLDYNGSISKTTDGVALAIQSKSGGTVSFDGPVTATGAADGILISGNSATSIAFTGTLTLDTRASGTRAFSATGAGTLTATGAGSTITAGAMAMLVGGITIGAEGLTFQSISAGSSTAGAGLGIALDTTGSIGGLRVTGTGSPGSGGTIQHLTGPDGSISDGVGIFLSNTSNVSLAHMQLNDFDNYAIRASYVTGFALIDSVVNGTSGTASDEHAVLLNNPMGGVLISGSTISGGYSDALHVENTGGTQADLRVYNTAITGTNASTASDALEVVVQPASVMNVTVTNSTLSTARDKVARFRTVGNGIMNAVFRDNTVTNAITFANIAASGGGVLFTNFGSMTFDISGNTFDYSNGGSGIKGVGLNVTRESGSTGTFIGRIVGNTVGADGVPLSGGGPASPALYLETQGSGASTVLIQDNTAYHHRDAGIRVFNGIGGSTLNAVVVGNRMAQPEPAATAGFAFTAVDGTTNLVLGGASGFANDFSDGDPDNGNDVTLETAASGVLKLSQASSSSAVAATVFADNNTPPATTLSVSGPGLAVASPKVVRLIGSQTRVLEDGTDAITYTFLRWGDTRDALTANFSVEGTAGFGDDYTQSGADSFDALSGSVTFAAGSPVATVTIHPSSDATPEPDETAILTLTLGDYTIDAPGQVTGTIRTDDTVPAPFARLSTPAMGHGEAVWATAGTSFGAMRRAADAVMTLGRARDRIAAAVSVHRVATWARAVVRGAADTLGTVAARVASAAVTSLHASGETLDVDLGMLPAGKSVTVVFDVTVDSPPVASYGNHATVMWTNFGTTDSNAVTTDGDLFDTTTAVVSSLNPIDQDLSVTFTATVTSEGTGYPPGGTVNFDFGDGTPVFQVSCAASAGDTCTAALAHTFVAGALYTVTAAYQGGTNHDASSGTVDQTVIPCTANPIVTNSDDSGAGSLRQALADACGTSGNNLITFNTGSVVGPITLTTGELVPARDVTVQWTGATRLEITRDSAWGDFRIFHVPTGRTVTLDKLKITNGSLNLFGLAGRGGGILNEGTLTITNTIVSGNTVAGKGGGIANSASTAGTTATLTIRDSTVSDNVTSYIGGGLVNEASDPSSSASVTILNSLFSGNSANDAGGLFNDGSMGTVALTVTSTTISGNVAGGGGGGLYVSLGTVSISGGTVTNNVSNTFAFPPAFPIAGGIQVAAGTLTLNNTIVAGNSTAAGPDDIRGAVDPVSSHNLIGEGSRLTGIASGVSGNQIGTLASPIDPKLGPLQGNGGNSKTHALLPGSPAIDAGDNSLVTGSYDQRGSNDFGRLKDGPDADATATVDIGAFEVDPTVAEIPDQAVSEDQYTTLSPLQVSFDVGDTTTGTLTFDVSSSNTTLVPNANLSVTGAASTRTLNIVPAANQNGTTTIEVTVHKSLGSVILDATDTFVLTVNPVNDAPTIAAIADTTSSEDTPQSVDLLGISTGAANENQTITVTATSNNHALIPDPVVTYASANATGSLTYTPVANASGTATITVTVQDSGGTLIGGVDTTVRTFAVTVNPVADAPSITNATTSEDTQTTSGLVISKNSADGAEVTHFRIVNIQNGTLYKNNGTTAIGNGAFITLAEGAAGLKFTPASNFSGTATFDVYSSLSNQVSGVGTAFATATITVTPVADTPSVTNATTLAQVQTTSGLVITPNAADGAEVTHFKISAVISGTLFKNDGTTAIANNTFITKAEGAAGLKFTPADGFAGTALFQVRASLSGADGGLGGGTATASITVNKHTTTTAIQSASPNPSDLAQPIPVVFSVSTIGGGPPATGNVIVTISGGSETCTAAAATGRCTLTPMVTGVRQIRASYQGDSVTAASASGLASHTVAACTVDPVVTSAAGDASAGTLRAALADACWGSTITFNISGGGPHVIPVGSTLILTERITITGSSDGVVLDGGNAIPIVSVNSPGDLTLNRLTLRNGRNSFGGAITSGGTLTIADSTLSGNHGLGGGAIASSGPLTIVRSTLSGNVADSGGGAIWSMGAGGATIVNSTISGNTAVADVGGGIMSDGTGGLTLTHVTITGNSAPARFAGGVSHSSGMTVANSIIAGNTSPVAPDTTGGYTSLGGNVIGGDPKLGPLQDNGGPTWTHAPLAGSPALDIGENALTIAAGLITDQRGAGFTRVLDAADANTTQTADAGAVEADAIVEVLPNIAIDEDAFAAITFNVGDATTPTAFDSIVATSDNPGLLPGGGVCPAAAICLTGTGSTRTLTLTPIGNLSGAATITVTATKTVGGVAQTSQTSFTLMVNSVNDTPTLSAIASPSGIPEDSSQQTVSLGGISAGGGESQTLTVTATSSNPALVAPAVAYTSPTTTGTITYTPAPNTSGTATITVTVTDQLGAQAIQTFAVTVGSVADAPAIDSVQAIEDGQSELIRITRNAADGGEVTHFKVLSITGGTVARAVSGLPAVTAGQFLTIAQGSAGLIFSPAPNSTATGHITVQASIGATDAGLGGSAVTADITVLSVPDPPAVTATATLEDMQTTSGLVVTRNAVDGPDVTHFKIIEIFNGKLYQHDGFTEIPVNTVITAAQGAAGLKYTPSPNFFGSGSVLVIGALDASGAGNGGLGGGGISVTAVADTPSITNATTVVNAQTTSGLIVSRSAADGAEVTHVKVTGITGGTLFQANGTTPIGNGAFITMAQGAAGLRFTPAADSVTTGHVTIQAATSATDAGLGGALVTADVVVNKLTSTTTVTTSKTPANPGESVTFTATVTPALAGANGTVQFKDGSTTLGAPVTLSSGSASFSTSLLAPGLHPITAVYSGNTLALTSTGALTGGQLVRTPVTLSISSSGNPTLAGQSVTIFATPTHAGGGVAGGTMAFKEGATTLASLALSGGTASFTTTTFTLGVHNLTVEYSGDGAFAPAIGTFAQTMSCPVMTVGPATIPAASVGVAYSQTFTQSGGVGPTAFSLVGTAPAGLSFTVPTATLSGVPTAPGTYAFSITATPANGCGAVTASYTLQVGGGRAVLTGADAGGGPHVRRFNALDGSTPSVGVMNSFFPFNPLFTGGVRVAEGDVNGDGVPDPIAGSGPGGLAQVSVFDGATGATIRTFTAFESTFTGGVFVAAGDVNGDGYADIVAGSGVGRSGEVKVFSGRDGAVLRDTFVFSPAFTGGVRVAAGDVNGDGMADLVAGTGEGTAATVTILSGSDLALLRTFAPYGGFPSGVFVAAGDVTGDGFADVITGAGPGGGPHVRVFDGVSGAVVRSFLAFDTEFKGGVRVAAGDVTGDGRAEIIAGAGPGGAPEVRLFDGVSTALLSTQLAYPVGFTGGVFVATAVPQHRMVIDVAGLSVASASARAADGPALSEQGRAEGPSATSRRPSMISGWAYVENHRDAGISAIHVYAQPVTGGAPIFVGVATLGDPRPDVAARFGQQYGATGFHLSAQALPPGTYDLAVFAQCAQTGTFEIARTLRITRTP